MTTAEQNGGSGGESVVQPCPNCLKNLRLTRKLHGKQVGCKGCGTALLVSADPWSLSIVEEKAEPPKPAEPVVAEEITEPAGPLPLSLSDDSLGGDDFPAATPDATSQGAATAKAAAADTAARAGKAGAAAAAGAATQQRKLKLSAKPLIIGGVAVAAAVVLLVVGAVVASMLFGGGGDPLAYVPDHSNAIASINVERIVNSSIFQRMLEQDNSPLKQAQEGMKSEAGMDFSDIERIVVAGNTSSPNEVVGVVKFSGSVDLEELVGNVDSEFRRTARDGLIIYENPGAANMSLSLADDYTLLIGTTDQICRVRRRNGEPRLPDKLRASVEQLDFSQAIVGTMAVPDELPELPPNMPVPPGMLDKVAAIALQIDVSSDVTIAVTLICQDAEAAEHFKKMADGMIAEFRESKDTPPDLRKTIESLEVTYSGQTVSAQITVGEKLIDQAMKQAVPGM